jgi:hypothetical protein
VVCSSSHPEALFHAPGTYGIHPPEHSPRQQHRPLIEVGSLLKPCRSPVPLSTAPSEECKAEVEMRQPNVPTLTDSATQQTSHQQVLIHSRVRSHPAPVLPVAGGRYSHGVVVPSRVLTERFQPEGYPLMYLPAPLQAETRCTSES